MEKFKFTEREKKLIQSFGRNSVRFIVVGASSAVLQGAFIVTGDIDLWIEELGSENFLKAIREADCFYVPPGLFGQNPPIIGPSEAVKFDIVLNIKEVSDFMSEYKTSIEMEVDGEKIKILPLEKVIAAKKAANRPKDLAALPALEIALQAIKKLKDKN